MSSSNSSLGLGSMGLNFLTLEDAAKRLSHHLAEKITPMTILDYGIQDSSDLVFSVYCNSWFLFRKTVDASGAISITRDLLNGLIDLHPWTVNELRAKENVEITWIKACGGARVCAVSLHHWGHDPDSWNAVFDHHLAQSGRTFPWISRSDLRIKVSELERLSSQLNPQSPHAESVLVDKNDYLKSIPDDVQIAANSPTNNPKKPGTAQSIPQASEKEKADQKRTRAESWKMRAKELAEELDPNHTTAKLHILAQEIRKKLIDEEYLNRNRKPPSVETIEREILRGWKSKLNLSTGTPP